MTEAESVHNPDERIIRIHESCDGLSRVYFVIYDVYLNYWRSKEHLSSNQAWTRDMTERAEFPTFKAAQNEMEDLWQCRMEEACE